MVDDGDDPQRWLVALRDGLPWQKVEARERLADIFERRGMLEEATELLVANAQAGAGSAELFRWLSRLYRAQGDELTAMQAAAEAAKYITPQSPPATAEPTSQSTSIMAAAQPSELYLSEVEGQCAECGYVNRHQRANCKRCRKPLQAILPSGPAYSSPVASQAAYGPASVPIYVPMQAPGPVSFETRVRIYKSSGSFQREASKLAQQGWSVTATTSRQPRAGCLRILTLGIWTVVFPPKPEIVVTYSRQTH